MEGRTENRINYKITGRTEVRVDENQWEKLLMVRNVKVIADFPPFFNTIAVVF